MADTIQFTLTAHEMKKYLAWRAEVEAATGQPRHWFRLMSYALLSQISGHYRWRKS
jgi:hypothetical protein